MFPMVHSVCMEFNWYMNLINYMLSQIIFQCSMWDEILSVAGLWYIQICLALEFPLCIKGLVKFKWDSNLMISKCLCGQPNRCSAQ